MTGWTVIIPVKPSELAKSRIDLPPGQRSALARALTCDVLEAVGAADSVEQIVIVSARPELAEQARRHRAVILEDRPLLIPDGLNGAVETGRRWAASRRPDAPVVVVPADLPCLTPAIVDAALTRMALCSRAFVPDFSASGTTLLGAALPDLLWSSYGPESCQRHVDAGLTPVHDVDDRARLDVDTVSDLRHAAQLGLGVSTDRELRRLRDRRVHVDDGTSALKCLAHDAGRLTSRVPHHASADPSLTDAFGTSRGRSISTTYSGQSSATTPPPM
jgi:2-phospho-L-lactate guanylyltransferase